MISRNLAPIFLLFSFYFHDLSYGEKDESTDDTTTTTDII